MQLLSSEVSLSGTDKEFPFVIQVCNYNQNIVLLQQDDRQIFFVIDGTAEVVCEEWLLHVKVGTICSIGENTILEFRNCKNLKLCKVLYNQDTLSIFPEDIRRMESFSTLENIRKNRVAKRQLSLRKFQCIHYLMMELTEIYEKKEAVRNIVAKSLLVNLFLLFLKEETGSKVYDTDTKELEEIDLYIQKHYRKNISIKELADRTNMSPRNFSRIFHKIYGIPPWNYIIKLRLEHACELLIKSPLTISQIAFSSGFQDSNYFSRQFKENYGVSPREYRRRFDFG